MTIYAWKSTGIKDVETNRKEYAKFSEHVPNSFVINIKAKKYVQIINNNQSSKLQTIYHYMIINYTFKLLKLFITEIILSFLLGMKNKKKIALALKKSIQISERAFRNRSFSASSLK